MSLISQFDWRVHSTEAWRIEPHPVSTVCSSLLIATLP
jgi:hypothetical protein